LNALAQLRAAVGTLARVDGLVRVEGHVNSAPGWTAELPLNAAVELVVTAKVRD